MGADLVIESMHKTLPTFTQTALLHLSKEGKKRVDEKKIKTFLVNFSDKQSFICFYGKYG